MNDLQLFTQIRQRDRAAFNTLFREYYIPLCRFSFTLCLSREEAEEIIQDLFVNFWEKAPGLEIGTSVKAYLYTSARNFTLNAMQKRQTELRHLNEYADGNKEEEEESKLSETELAALIRSGVEELPDKCREIFILSKQEGLTHDEIANYLNISEKTVENQMTLALRKLREYLYPRLQKLLMTLFFYLFS